MVRGKPKAAAGHQLAEELPPGVVFSDLRKNKWKIGKPIGSGGFGLIYLADKDINGPVGNDANFVIKVEPKGNGPLFTEIAFYQRAAQQKDINEWEKKNKYSNIGVPAYIAHGLDQERNLRFLVMPRFGKDIHTLWKEADKKFMRETVAKLAINLITSLQYMHEKEYVHADIKGANILMGYGQKNSNKVYLVDFGLAVRYSSDGKHKEYKEEPKKAHDGTIEYTSIDAHYGVSPARRSDMQILGFVLVHWLTGTLPWEKSISNKVKVRDMKEKCLSNIKKFVADTCQVPEIQSYLEYVHTLEYNDEPDYDKMRKIFMDTLKQMKVSTNSALNFKSEKTKGSKRSFNTASDNRSSEELEIKKSKPTKGKKSQNSKAKPRKAKIPETTSTALSGSEGDYQPNKKRSRKLTKKTSSGSRYKSKTPTSNSDFHDDTDVTSGNISFSPKNKRTRKGTKSGTDYSSKNSSEMCTSDEILAESSGVLEVSEMTNLTKKRNTRSTSKNSLQTSRQNKSQDSSIEISEPEVIEDDESFKEEDKENSETEDVSYIASPVKQKRISPKLKKSRYSMAPLHTTSVLGKDDTYTGKMIGKHKEIRRKRRKNVPKANAETQTTPSLRKAKSRF